MTWAQIGYALTFSVFLTFTLLYGLTKPRLWIHEPLGRSVMILSTTLTLVLLNAMLGIGLEINHPVRATLRAVVLPLGFFSGAYLLHNLVRLQAEGRRIRRAVDAGHYPCDDIPQR